MTLIELLRRKESEVLIYRSDLVSETETDDWRKKHKTGPVHVRINCKLCGELLADDLPEHGHYQNDSFWDKHLFPHFMKNH